MADEEPIPYALFLEFRKPARDPYGRAGLAATVSQDKMFCRWRKDLIAVNFERMAEDFVFDYKFANRSSRDLGAL